MADGEYRFGTIVKDTGSFGFIAQDEEGSENMFVLPASCNHIFAGRIPPIGTRVMYQVVTDVKTGRLRADNVQPEGADPSAPPAAPVEEDIEAEAAAALGLSSDAAGDLLEEALANISGPSSGEPSGKRRRAGEIMKAGGNFGFIKQDGLEENMFIIPASCALVGGIIPPQSTRITFEVVTDAKTGRPRAHNVLLEGGGGKGAPLGAGRLRGKIIKCSATFGFIEQDDGGDNMFVIPSSCPSLELQIPPIGTHVTYSIVTDSRTGRPRAENVLIEASSSSAWGGWKGGGGWTGDSWKGGGKGFGGKGNSRLPAAMMALASWGAEAPAPAGKGGGANMGTVVQIKGSYGFIEQDEGGENMFVLPGSCPGFGGQLPPPGTRVQYEVVVDSKTGRPRAEAVQPALDWAGPAGGAKGGNWWDAAAAWCAGGGGGDWGYEEPQLAGSIAKISGGYGFIQQDSGGENMFVIPSSCEAFGSVIPPEGTRVCYNVSPDEKTGRPRATNVVPESGSGSWGKGGGWGKACGKSVGKGKAKGCGHPYAALPY